MRVRRSVLGPILVACTKRFITQPHAASVSSAPGSGDIGPVSNSAQTSAAQQELEATAAPKLNLQHLQNRMAMASVDKSAVEKNKMNSNMKGGSWFRAQTGRSADEQPIILEAHRGGGETMAENEIPAFLYAGQQGVDQVEFDVWLTSDNKLAISHGPDIIPEGHSIPTLAELKEVNENDNIPLLEDVIGVCKQNNLFMNVEIKPDNAVVADMVIDLLTKEGALANAVISSFERSVLARAIERGGIGIGSLYNPGYFTEGGTKLRQDSPDDFASWIVQQREQNGQSVHPHDTVNLCIEKVTSKQVTEAHDLGVGAMIWFPMETDTDENVAKAMTVMKNAAPSQRKVVCVNKLDKVMDGIAGLVEDGFRSSKSAEEEKE